MLDAVAGVVAAVTGCTLPYETQHQQRGQICDHRSAGDEGPAA